MIWAYLAAMLGGGGLILSTNSHIPPGAATLIGLVGGVLVVVAVRIGYEAGRAGRR